MTISQYFPIYDQLDKADQERLDYAAVKRSVPKGTLLHGGDGVCTGLLVIASRPAPGPYDLRRGEGDHSVPAV